ncbi:MAG: phage tail tube protein [Acidobacteriota bacterium]|mgnify:CR=1 FL=1
MSIRLGLDAKTYRNTGNYDVPIWTEVPNVKDVTMNLESGEADVSTRANAGWRATVATMKEGTIEFEMLWDTEDAGFTAIKNAYFNNTPIEMAVMDGSITVPGAQGLRASFSVMSFSRKEALEEALTVSVTLKITHSAHAPEWKVAA